MEETEEASKISSTPETRRSEGTGAHGQKAIYCTVCAAWLCASHSPVLEKDPKVTTKEVTDKRNIETEEKLALVPDFASEKKECDTIDNTENNEHSQERSLRDDKQDGHGQQNPLFIALACTGQCKLQEKKLQQQDSTDCYSYFCVPGCLEHFLQYQWGIYSGLGQAHKGWPRGLFGNACDICRSDLQVVPSFMELGLSLEQAMAKLSPEILAKGLTIFHEATIETQEQQQGQNGQSSNFNNSLVERDRDEATIVRRMTQELEDMRLLKCPSCHCKIAIPEDRGCDAAWCEHCGRALCLYCFTDCGDHTKTDPTANQHFLIGDAHAHVLENDCGLTAGKGVIHSGKALLWHHKRRFLQHVGLRLKRVPECIRDQVCRNLDLSWESVKNALETNGNRGRPSAENLAGLSRTIENDKWEHYRQEMRVGFLHAAYDGNLLLVLSLLDAGIPAAIPDVRGGETALHFAAVTGQIAIAQVLLEYGANPWQISPQGRTPLDDLCNIESSGDLATARCLVRACMMSLPALSFKKIVYPWERKWPNGTTAQASAKRFFPDSELDSYFKSLNNYAARLNLACTKGRLDEVRHRLSNETDNYPNPCDGDEADQELPPAEDLVWVYNRGSGCTPLLDLCAKSVKLSPQHALECKK
jgi:hypothetical protein